VEGLTDSQTISGRCMIEEWVMGDEDGAGDRGSGQEGAGAGMQVGGFAGFYTSPWISWVGRDPNIDR
jgi:hypothetical protein